MDIFSAIPGELALLGEAVLMGAGMFALYDCIRILRRVFPHGIFWISLEDALYWIAAAGWFFLRICKTNSGIIRFYVILALGVGAGLYYVLFGRLMMKYVSFLILRVKKGLKKTGRNITIKLKQLKKHEDEI